MTINEITKFADSIKNKPYIERNRSRILFLDLHFNQAHAWNLANKIIQEYFQFGNTTYDVNQSIS